MQSSHCLLQVRVEGKLLRKANDAPHGYITLLYFLEGMDFCLEDSPRARKIHQRVREGAHYSQKGRRA